MQDAQDLMQALLDVSNAKTSLKEAIDKYGEETAKRGAEAVDIAASEGKVVQDMDRLHEMVLVKSGFAK